MLSVKAAIDLQGMSLKARISSGVFRRARIQCCCSAHVRAWNVDQNADPTESCGNAALKIYQCKQEGRCPFYPGALAHEKVSHSDDGRFLSMAELPGLAVNVVYTQSILPPIH
jgi:hypothetical protein